MRTLALALVLVSSSAGAATPPRRRGAPIPLRVELTIGAEQLDYRNAQFGADPKLDGKSVGHLNLLGRQFGASAPKLLDVGLHVEGITHHVVLGTAFGFLYAPLNHLGVASTSGTDPIYGSSMAGPTGTGNSLTGMYLGATVGTAWTWKAFDMAFTTTMGYRQVGVPLLDFDKVPCKGGYCNPSATSYAFFAQPRLALGIHHDSWGMGGYVGAELTTQGSGWATGVYFEGADSLFRRHASAIDPEPDTNPPKYP